MSGVGIAGIGVVGPGIGSWPDAVRVLAGDRRFNAAAELPWKLQSALPANERRRITPLIRMALQCANDAVRGSSLEDSRMRSVFSSSCGDLRVVDRILHALTLPDKPVSPTHFHNSVHNAPAGYWSIGRRDMSASVSLSVHDSSFGAGLLNAVSIVLAHGGPTLLVAYDDISPPPMSESRRLLAPFAVGLVLTGEPAQWSMAVSLRESGTSDAMDDPALEAMRAGNPAARSLPLLARLASSLPGNVRIGHLNNLVIDVRLDRGG